jgi:hypothetical protein
VAADYYQKAGEATKVKEAKLLSLQRMRFLAMAVNKAKPKMWMLDRRKYNHQDERLVEIRILARPLNFAFVVPSYKPLSFTTCGSICFGCNGTENKEPLEYKGPLSEVENVELYYSENDMVKVKMVADLLYEFANGDREFPNGVHMEFFDETGKLESTLRANHAFYFKADDQWRGRGDVEAKNVQIE